MQNIPEIVLKRQLYGKQKSNAGKSAETRIKRLYAGEWKISFLIYQKVKMITVIHNVSKI